MTKDDLITIIKTGNKKDAEDAIDKYFNERFNHVIINGFAKNFDDYAASYKKDNTLSYALFKDGKTEL